MAIQWDEQNKETETSILNNLSWDDKPDNLDRNPTVENESGVYKKYIKPIAYPVAETLGMVGGGIAGTGVSPIAGTVAGAALGYGAVKQGEKIVENFLGIGKPETFKEATMKAGKDVATGAALEMSGQVIGKGVGMLAERGAKKLYQSALKPNKGANLSLEKIDRRIQTGLNENIPVSKGGYNKANKIIGDMNKQIDSRLSQLAHESIKIEREAALSPVQREIPKMFKKNITPMKDVNNINDYMIEIQNTQPEKIGIQQAQEFKKFLGKELNNYFASVGGKIAPATSETTAKSAMAKGLREEISKAFPEITALNSREGSVIELNKSMANAVNRINNRELIPLLVGFGMGSAPIQQSFWKALVFKLVDQPYVKSKLGIVLHKAAMAKVAEPTAKTIGVMLNQGNEEE